MTGRRMIAFVLALLLIEAPWSSATAEPVLYTIKFVASGTVGSVPFIDEPLVFAGVTDTDTVAALTEADPSHLTQLIFALSYVAGFALIITSIVKLKAHKDNPQQTTLGPPHAFGFAVEVSLPGPLSMPVVREGGLVTLTIDSILNNTLEVEPRHVPGRL